jgi:hypothetical protein
MFLLYHLWWWRSWLPWFCWVVEEPPIPPCRNSLSASPSSLISERKQRVLNVWCTG